MAGSMIIIDLLGGVALLLWVLRTIHSDIMRTFRRRPASDARYRTEKPLHRFPAGLDVTAILQSSTATCPMTASLAAGRVVARVER